MLRRLLATMLSCAFALTAQAPGMPAHRMLPMRDQAAEQEDSIGRTVDPNLAFTDERGYPFKLQQWFPGKRPVLLMLGYYSCPAMCGTVLGSAFRALSDTDLQPGDDYLILNVSIDPKETPEIAKARKQNFLPKLAKTGGEDAWRVLVGDENNIQQLADTVGFHFYWAEATKQFAHPASLIFLTPEGKVSRVIGNAAFQAEDVRLALIEASNGKLGTFWDQVKLNCMTFDPTTNSYSVTAMTIMRIGGVITVVVLAVMIWVMLRRERGRRPAHTTSAAA